MKSISMCVPFALVVGRSPFPLLGPVTRVPLVNVCDSVCCRRPGGGLLPCVGVKIQNMVSSSAMDIAGRDSRSAPPDLVLRSTTRSTTFNLIHAHYSIFFRSWGFYKQTKTYTEIIWD